MCAHLLLVVNKKILKCCHSRNGNIQTIVCLQLKVMSDEKLKCNETIKKKKKKLKLY